MVNLPDKILNDDDVRFSRSIAAKAIMDIVRSRGNVILIGNERYPLIKMMDDQKLVISLMKMSMFFVGAQSFSDMTQQSFGGRTAPRPMKNIPVGMVGLAFDYTLKVMGKEVAKNDVIKQAVRIEKRFGKVPVDPILMSEISALAKEENAHG